VRNVNRKIPALFLFTAVIYGAFFLIIPGAPGAQEKAGEVKTVKLSKPKLDSGLSVEQAMRARRSIRRYSPRELTEGEISRLLWACQGVTDRRGFRTAPSAGARYPLEIYLVNNEGVFLYLADSHELEEKSSVDLKKNLARAAWGQQFIEQAPVNIVICAVYERVKSRYGERGARYTDIEVGHAAQNVHLEAVSLGLVSCPVGAFDDNKVSEVLSIPEGQIPVYIIPVGHKG